MVQAANDGGRSRTADLEAQRKAQEAARRRAEEAARKAAEEALRKAEAEAKKKAEEQRAQQEAKRLADKQSTGNSETRKDGYQVSKTQPLSAETARLQGVMSAYIAEPDVAPKPAASKTPALDAAKAKAASSAGEVDAGLKEAKDKFPQASEGTLEKVAELQAKAETESQKVLDTATQEADKLVAEAERIAADKSPMDREKIFAEADRRATSILEAASASSQTIQGKAVELGEAALKESHDYEASPWFQKLATDVGNFLGDAWEKTTEIFDSAVDTVGDIKDFAVEQAGNFTEWVGDQAFKAVDGALDSSALGDDNEYTQEQTGMLGELITNRLEVGESAFIKLDADANINGVALGAGAELEVKRVPATNADGSPKLEPKDEHGEPPTELQVTLVVDARAGVGLEAEFGAGAAKQTGKSVAGNDINPGAEVSASASAEAGVQAKATFTFHFDPTSQQDMQDLTGVLGATAKSSLPGIGLAFAGDAVEAASNFGRHLTSISGEFGVYASAQASASANLGNVDADSLGTGGKAGITGQDPSKSFGNMAIDEASGEEDGGPDYGLQGTAAGEALSAANLNLGEITAGISGEVNVGAQHDFRTGETTIYLNVKGSASASASTVGDLSAGASGESDRTIALTIKDGELQGIDVVETMSGSKFHGVGKTDVMGRLQDDVLVQVSNSDTVSITRSYTPEALGNFKQSAQDNLTKGLGDLTDSLLRPDPNPKLEVTDIKATKSEEFSIGGKIMGTGLKLTVGQRLETDLDNIEAPANQNAETRDQSPETAGAR